MLQLPKAGIDDGSFIQYLSLKGLCTMYAIFI